MRQAGFTLVELLVALLLFGMLSAASVGLLSFGVDARARTGQRLDETAALLRSRALLTADLAQAAPRRWRNGDGSAQAAFSSDGAALLRLVRRGWRNDGSQPRASLQRIDYRLVGSVLERRAWPMVDGAEPGPPQPVLTGVRSARLRFHSQGEWRGAWQPVAGDALPDAVELTVTTDSLPELRQMFLVGPGNPA